MFDWMVRKQEKRLVKRIEKNGKKILDRSDQVLDDIAKIVTAVINVFVPKENKKP